MAKEHVVVITAFVALFAGAVGASHMGDAQRTSSGAVSQAGQLDFTQLKPGDCIEHIASDLPGASSDAVDELFPVVPCSSTHRWEVYGVKGVTDATFDDQSLTSQSTAFCEDRLKTYAGDLALGDELTYSYYKPGEDSWLATAHLITCLVGYVDGRTWSGSLHSAISN